MKYPSFEINAEGESLLTYENGATDQRRQSGELETCRSNYCIKNSIMKVTRIQNNILTIQEDSILQRTDDRSLDVTVEYPRYYG